MADKSQTFQRFLDSFAVTGRESAEDYDIDALQQLQGEELDRAEQMLVERVTQTADPRAPRALRYLGYERAVPALRQALASQEGQMRVEVAFTLWSLSGDESAVAAIIQVLQEGDEYDRIAAANTLQHFSGAIVDQALFAAINDPDRLVRGNAVESLYTIHGLAAWEKVPGQGLSLLGLRLRSGFASVRKGAVRELRDIIAAKALGKSAEEIGIPLTGDGWSPDALNLIRSFSSPAGQPPWAEDYDLESLARLQGGEKVWAEYAFLFNLEKGDFRAARALVHLGSRRAVEPFRELLGSSGGRVVLEAALGLWQLDGDARGRAQVEQILATGIPSDQARAAEVQSLIGA